MRHKLRALFSSETGQLPPKVRNIGWCNAAGTQICCQFYNYDETFVVSETEVVVAVWDDHSASTDDKSNLRSHISARVKRNKSEKCQELRDTPATFSKGLLIYYLKSFA